MICKALTNIVLANQKPIDLLQSSMSTDPIANGSAPRQSESAIKVCNCLESITFKNVLKRYWIVFYRLLQKREEANVGQIDKVPHNAASEQALHV